MPLPCRPKLRHGSEGPGPRPLWCERALQGLPGGWGGRVRTLKKPPRCEHGDSCGFRVRPFSQRAPFPWAVPRGAGSPPDHLGLAHAARLWGEVLERPCARATLPNAAFLRGLSPPAVQRHGGDTLCSREPGSRRCHSPAVWLPVATQLCEPRCPCLRDTDCPASSWAPRVGRRTCTAPLGPQERPPQPPAAAAGLALPSALAGGSGDAELCPLPQDPPALRPEPRPQVRVLGRVAEHGTPGRPGAPHLDDCPRAPAPPGLPRHPEQRAEGRRALPGGLACRRQEPSLWPRAAWAR